MSQNSFVIPKPKGSDVAAHRVASWTRSCVAHGIASHGTAKFSVFLHLSLSLCLSGLLRKSAPSRACQNFVQRVDRSHLVTQCRASMRQFAPAASLHGSILWQIRLHQVFHLISCSAHLWISLGSCHIKHCIWTFRYLPEFKLKQICTKLC